MDFTARELFDLNAGLDRLIKDAEADLKKGNEPVWQKTIKSYIEDIEALQIKVCNIKPVDIGGFKHGAEITNICSL